MDGKEVRCPQCGGTGEKMHPATLRSLVKDEYLPHDLEGYFMCRSAGCDVVYFGEKLIYRDQIKVPVWFKEKDKDVPVCYCREVTVADIYRHVADLGCCRDLEDIKNHTGANTGRECLVKNPAGT